MQAKQRRCSWPPERNNRPRAPNPDFWAGTLLSAAQIAALVPEQQRQRNVMQTMQEQMRTLRTEVEHHAGTVVELKQIIQRQQEMFEYQQNVVQVLHARVHSMEEQMHLTLLARMQTMTWAATGGPRAGAGTGETG